MRPGLDRLAVDRARLVDDGEAVAALQVLVEIDLGAEHVGELQRHRVGQPCRVGRGEERRADLARRHAPAHVDRRGRRRRRQHVAVARDRQEIAGGRDEPELEQRPRAIGRDAQRLARTQLVERPRGRVPGEERERLRIVDAQAHERAADRVAAPDSILVPVAARGIVIEQRERRGGQRADRRSRRAAPAAGFRARGRTQRRRRARARRARSTGAARSRARAMRRSCRRFALEFVLCARPWSGCPPVGAAILPQAPRRCPSGPRLPRRHVLRPRPPSRRIQARRRRADRRERARREAEARQAAANQGRLRSDAAGPASGPHRPVQQAAAAAGPGPPHHLPDRRLHRADRRPHRPQRDAPGTLGRGDRREREDLHRPGVPDPRPREDGSRVQLEVALAARRRRDDPARGEVHGRADARARRLREALPGRPADRDPRVPLSARAGLRLGRAEGRRRARRHRPEVQPAGRPRAAAPLRTGAAVHPDLAAARGPGRRQQDVEVARQLRRHHRARERDVRQADVDLRRAHVALLRAAVVPAARRHRGAEARVRRRAQPARREGRARAGDRRAVPLEGRGGPRAGRVRGALPRRRAARGHAAR